MHADERGACKDRAGIASAHGKGMQVGPGGAHVKAGWAGPGGGGGGGGGEGGGGGGGGGGNGRGGGGGQVACRQRRGRHCQCTDGWDQGARNGASGAGRGALQGGGMCCQHGTKWAVAGAQ